MTHRALNIIISTFDYEFFQYVFSFGEFWVNTAIHHDGKLKPPHLSITFILELAEMLRWSEQQTVQIYCCKHTCTVLILRVQQEKDRNIRPVHCIENTTW